MAVEAEKHMKRLCGRKTELSEDLEVEILLRLPLKLLLRFKCVCKSWYKLITSPHFARVHYTTYQRKIVSVYLLNWRYDPNNRESNFSLCFSDKKVDATFGLAAESYVRIVGCCHGVVCLFLSDVFALWNTATSLFKKIGGHYDTKDLYNCGFGFDPIVNSFKVVCVLIPNNNNAHNKEISSLKMNILTASTNSWREENRVLPFCYFQSFVSKPVTCMGRYMYWDVKVDYSNTRNERYILCFDMVDEIFKRIELPSSCYCLVTGLVLYKDTIALFVQEEDGYYFDVWVMNDCGGTSQSWSRELTIKPSKKYFKYAEGFFIKDGVDLPVMTTFSDRYLLFNPDTGETTAFKSPGTMIEFFQYSESLISF